MKEYLQDHFRPAFPIPPLVRREVEALAGSSQQVSTDVLRLQRQRNELKYQLELLNARIDAYGSLMAEPRTSPDNMGLESPPDHFDPIDRIESGIRTLPRVGQLVWNKDLGDRFRNPGESPGNVSGHPCCNGVFISKDKFLTSAIGLRGDAGGWQLPTRRGCLIPVTEMLKHLQILCEGNGRNAERKNLAEAETSSEENHDEGVSSSIRPLDIYAECGDLMVLNTQSITEDSRQLGSASDRGQETRPSLDRSQDPLFLIPFNAPTETEGGTGALDKSGLLPVNRVGTTVLSDLTQQQSLFNPATRASPPKINDIASHPSNSLQYSKLLIDEQSYQHYYLSNRILLGSPLIDSAGTIVGIYLGKNLSLSGHTATTCLSES